MTGDVAVVTGGAAGLGRCITEVLVRTGRHVVIADRDLDSAGALADEARRNGGMATARHVDVAEPSEAQQLIEDAAALGVLGVVINNAGGWLPGPQYPDTQSWPRSLALNLRAPMLITQLALPLMTERGGAVVNVASSGGLEPAGYESPEYAAAKAGLIRFTTAVRDFAERFGVRVSCVVPHWIELERAVQAYAAMSPAERQASGGLVSPETVAAEVVRLAEDPGSAGQVMIIRPGRPPYPMDPADADPHQHSQYGDRLRRRAFIAGPYAPPRRPP